MDYRVEDMPRVGMHHVSYTGIASYKLISCPSLFAIVETLLPTQLLLHPKHFQNPLTLRIVAKPALSHRQLTELLISIYPIH